MRRITYFIVGLIIGVSLLSIKAQLPLVGAYKYKLIGIDAKGTNGSDTNKMSRIYLVIDSEGFSYEVSVPYTNNVNTIISAEVTRQQGLTLSSP